MLSRKMHMIVTAVVILSACAWLPYAIMRNDLNVWLRVAAALVGILSFVILFERDMYLPFLADAAFPTSLLVPSSSANRIVGQGHVAVSIGNLPPNAKVVYWAAEAAEPRTITTKTWKEAYGDYSNVGVVMSNTSGIATFTIRCPQPYTVSQMGLTSHEIPPHVHYRYELPGTKGMLSEVYTHAVRCVPK